MCPSNDDKNICKTTFQNLLRPDSRMVFGKSCEIAMYRYLRGHSIGSNKAVGGVSFLELEEAMYLHLCQSRVGQALIKGRIHGSITASVCRKLRILRDQGAVMTRADGSACYQDWTRAWLFPEWNGDTSEAAARLLIAQNGHQQAQQSLPSAHTSHSAVSDGSGGTTRGGNRVGQESPSRCGEQLGGAQTPRQAQRLQPRQQPRQQPLQSEPLQQQKLRLHAQQLNEQLQHVQQQGHEKHQGPETQPQRDQGQPESYNGEQGHREYLVPPASMEDSEIEAGTDEPDETDQRSVVTPIKERFEHQTSNQEEQMSFAVQTHRQTNIQTDRKSGSAGSATDRQERLQRPTLFLPSAGPSTPQDVNRTPVAASSFPPNPTHAPSSHERTSDDGGQEPYCREYHPPCHQCDADAQSNKEDAINHIELNNKAMGLLLGEVSANIAAIKAKCEGDDRNVISHQNAASLARIRRGFLLRGRLRKDWQSCLGLDRADVAGQPSAYANLCRVLRARAEAGEHGKHTGLLPWSTLESALDAQGNFLCDMEF